MQRRLLHWNNIGFFFNGYEPPAETPCIFCE